ncbi:hypothetical protein PLESTF_001001000 [Pleodorina starrii]|nr:hypothetical protein PLESTF_001001000 [Pleodorina starrii]
MGFNDPAAFPERNSLFDAAKAVAEQAAAAGSTAQARQPPLQLDDDSRDALKFRRLLDDNLPLHPCCVCGIRMRRCDLQIHTYLQNVALLQPVRYSAHEVDQTVHRLQHTTLWTAPAAGSSDPGPSISTSLQYHLLGDERAGCIRVRQWEEAADCIPRNVLAAALHVDTEEEALSLGEQQQQRQAGYAAARFGGPEQAAVHHTAGLCTDASAHASVVDEEATAVADANAASAHLPQRHATHPPVPATAPTGSIAREIDQEALTAATLRLPHKSQGTLLQHLRTRRHWRAAADLLYGASERIGLTTVAGIPPKKSEKLEKHLSRCTQRYIAALTPLAGTAASPHLPAAAVPAPGQPDVYVLQFPPSPAGAAPQPHPEHAAALRSTAEAAAARQHSTLPAIDETAPPPAGTTSARMHAVQPAVNAAPPQPASTAMPVGAQRTPMYGADEAELLPSAESTGLPHILRAGASPENIARALAQQGTLVESSGSTPISDYGADWPLLAHPNRFPNGTGAKPDSM